MLARLKSLEVAASFKAFFVGILPQLCIEVHGYLMVQMILDNLLIMTESCYIHSYPFFTTVFYD